MRHIDDLDSIVAEHHITIAVIATPSHAAQGVADRLVAAGVTSILNFAPCVLSVPDGVDVRKVDLAIELQILSFHEHRKASAAGGPPGSGGPSSAGGRGTGDGARTAVRAPTGRPGRAGTGRRGGPAMNLLVVGVSHHTAPVELLERLVGAGRRDRRRAGRPRLRQPYVNEAVVLSTCNRVEVYAAVTAFHGGLAEIGAVLAGRAGLDVADAGRAPLRALRRRRRSGTPCGSPPGWTRWSSARPRSSASCATRTASAAEHDAAGRLLHELMQQALRVGKRVHAETGIDRAGQSIVTAALAAAPDGGRGRPGALVIGAGAMGSLAVATLRRAGVGPVLVTNRGAERAERLAELHGASVVDFADLAATLSTVDLVVCATASPEPVLTADTVARGARPPGRPARAHDPRPGRAARRGARGRPACPGVTLVDLAGLGAALQRAVRRPTSGRGDRRRRGRGVPDLAARAPRWRRPWPRCGPGPTRWSRSELRRLASGAPT